VDLEPIRFEAPRSLDEAVRMLVAGGEKARVLAGGTDLLVQMRTGRAAPQLIVDVKRIPELIEVREEGGGLSIGAAACSARVREHPVLRANWPGVAEAIHLIGSEQIQGRASVGGNLCNGSPAADTAPALIAVGARCLIQGPKGKREIPVEEFLISPGRTALGPGELLVRLLLPPADGGRDAYLRLIPRTEMDIAVVGAGVRVKLDRDGACREARVALGAVAPRPVVVPAAAEALVGSRIDDAALTRAAAAASAACDPIDDKRGTIDYRRKVAGVLTRRAATIAAQRARGRAS
jgi:carbon-monoxide dehydrogenase medium subunit